MSSACYLRQASAMAWAAAVLLMAAAPTRADSGKRYALLVGVNRYDHAKLSVLRYPENDVTELANLLRTSGYAVTLLTTGEGAKAPRFRPTRANIDQHLRLVLTRCKRGDLVLIALAGHGVQFSDVNDSFFCPQDAVPRPDAAGRRTLLSLQTLYKDLDQSGAGVKFLLVDACRDDPRAGRSVGINGNIVPRPPNGVAALFSCSGGERAFETDKYRHGVFFYHLLEGLRGKAKDRDDEVTWDSLAAYVRKQVPRDVPAVIGEGARQTPALNAGELTGEPPVLIGRGQTASARPSLAIRLGDGGTSADEMLGVTRAERAMVRNVTPDGGGDRLGLRRGDIILRVNDQDVPTTADVSAAFRKLSASDAVELEVQRGQERQRLSGRYATALSEVETFRSVREKAEAGDGAAQEHLASFYENGRGVAKDQEEAFHWYRKAAEAGEATAQARLGQMYAQGKGVTRDDAEALRWYRKAAAQNNALALNEVGVFYLQGMTVTRDFPEAARWFRKAADRGHANAQTNMALAYETGCGVAKDLAESVNWFRKAAEQNDRDALYALGKACRDGRGVARDDLKALTWFRKAGTLGHVLSQTNVGYMLAKGIGTAKNETEAVQWYRKAAEQGESIAQYNLAQMYHDGRGVAKNEAEALKWYRKAADQGDDDARQALQRLGGGK